MKPIAKQGDRVVGTDVHLVIPEGGGSPVPTPLPCDGELDAELSTYAHAGIVKSYAKRFAHSLAYLDKQLRATVNIDDACNAYSDGTTINFYRAGQGCENTGRIADVVYHEFGHSLHYQSIVFGVGDFDGALSEGISDYLAATITGDPAIVAAR